MRAAENGLWSPRIDGYQSIDPDEVEDIFDEIEAEKEIDLLIIDTAGDASRDHDTIATVTDLVLCPILLSKSDLDTARHCKLPFPHAGPGKGPCPLAGV